MKVYFIGAGPGAADLITVRGANILRQATTVLYAGSLVPEVILNFCSPETERINTANLTLEDQIKYYIAGKAKDLDIARLHSGDPTIYGAIGEQIQALNELEIEYEIIPGVSSFTASAASLGCSLTKPEVAQSIILTRVSGRASQVPEFEQLERLAIHKTTMCIFLAGARLPEVIACLSKHYEVDTPVALIHRVDQPEERRHLSTLSSILSEINIKDWQLTTMLLVGDVLKVETETRSKLYSMDYAHRFRPAKRTI